MTEPPPDNAKPRSTRLAGPAFAGMVLVVGVIILAVVFWPPGPGNGDDDPEEADPDPQGPWVLLATEEGEALLGDIFDSQVERHLERRNRHAKDSVRMLENQAKQAEAERRTIRDASDALSREGQKLPISAERTALLDVSVKLTTGPELTPNERLIVQKHDRIAGAALRLTRNGAVPLSALDKRHAAEREALSLKMKQRGVRLQEQARALERIVDLVRTDEDFDSAVVAASLAIQADRDFAEALVVRGALQLVAQGEYGRAIVDCDHAIRVDANNAAALVIRGFGMYHRGSAGGAQADFQQAITLEPHFRRFRVIFKLLDEAMLMAGPN